MTLHEAIGLICGTKATNEKTDKLDFIKILKFCISKDSMKRVKRQPTKREKLFVNQISDKGVVSRIYNKLFQ
jgi:hypothetical protein